MPSSVSFVRTKPRKTQSHSSPHQFGFREARPIFYRSIKWEVQDWSTLAELAKVLSITPLRYHNFAQVTVSARVTKPTLLLGLAPTYPDPSLGLPGVGPLAVIDALPNMCHNLRYLCIALKGRFDSDQQVRVALERLFRFKQFTRELLIAVRGPELEKKDVIPTNLDQGTSVVCIPDRDSRTNEGHWPDG